MIPFNFSIIDNLKKNKKFIHKNFIFILKSETKNVRQIETTSKNLNERKAGQDLFGKILF